MTDVLKEKAQRDAAEEAVVGRLAKWKGEDAIDLLRELNSIAARTYYSKWRS